MRATVVSTPLARSYWPADRSKPVLDITVGDLLRSAARGAPDTVALIDGHPDPDRRRSWTYAELVEDSERLARGLLERFRPGERLLVVAPNSADWVRLQMGAAMAGLVLATANPAYQDRELEHVLRRSRAVGVVVADAYGGRDLPGAIGRLAGGLPQVRDVLRLSRLDELLRAAPAGAPLPEVRPDDPAQIQYTGGTTGFPKGVELHHRASRTRRTSCSRRPGCERATRGSVSCRSSTWADA